MLSEPNSIRGRGTAENPGNRFEKLHFERDIDACQLTEEELPPQTILLKDKTSSVLTKNDSPDVGFDFSINPYRGCEHGCIYCFARPTHEYLGLSSGLDFETKIFVKHSAAELLRAELMHKNWVPQTVVMSGVTDCYQPFEKQFGLTRQCLEVFAEFRNPIAIITKNHLVTRD